MYNFVKLIERWGITSIRDDPATLQLSLYLPNSYLLSLLPSSQPLHLERLNSTSYLFLRNNNISYEDTIRVGGLQEGADQSNLMINFIEK